MEANSPEAIAAAWDGLCETYTGDLARPGKRKALAAVELAAIRKELCTRTGLRILDAGCGPGWHGVQLALDEHRVVMMDLSPKMLERACAAADAAGVQDRITLRQEDIRNSSLQPGSFDAVIACGTVVSDCGDPDAALAEFSKLLTGGGVALFSVRNLWASFDRQCLPGSWGDAKSWLDAGRRRVPQGHQAFDWVFFTGGGISSACQAAGLTLERVYPVAAVPPPHDDEGIQQVVRFHIDMADCDAALARAHELFAVARKADGSRQSREAASRPHRYRSAPN